MQKKEKGILAMKTSALQGGKTVSTCSLKKGGRTRILSGSSIGRQYNGGKLHIPGVEKEREQLIMRTMSTSLRGVPFLLGEIRQKKGKQSLYRF